MSTAYEPNIQGAIAVLRDLMIANSFTMTREPYEPNYRGLVDAVIDLKEGFPTFAPLQVGFDATAFEDVSEGDALYMRTSDGQVGKASASNGLQENAQVVGFANADASANATVKVIAPAVEGERKYKSPASKPVMLLIPITTTFTVAFAEASALANPTT